MIASLNEKVRSLEIGEQQLKEFIESTKEVIIEDQDDDEAIAERHKVIAERQKI